jgi:hypothetical protein
MKKIYENILIALWTIIATFVLARWWLINPDLFPTLPETLWERLSDAYGATCCEEQADLELLVSLSLSFVVVLSFTLLVLFLWRRIKLR